MKRRLFLLAAFLLMIVFGVTSTAVAQPRLESEGITSSSQSGLHSPQGVEGSDVIAPKDKNRAASSQRAVRQALLQHVESDPVLSTTSFDVSTSPRMDLRVQSDSDNGGRRIVYIIGGVLVAGGAIAGILALSSRGGNGGTPGIPPPGNRP